MIDLWTKLNCPKIQIIDVGAADYGDKLFDNLIQQGACDIVGFEPDEEQCKKLNEMGNGRFLPYFIGDGEEYTFYECKFGAASSIYEPNLELLSKFDILAEATTPISTRKVKTHTLWGLSKDIPAPDMLKMDVQGAEAKVLKGAKPFLYHTLVVHTEAMFLEMYKGQPLFAEIDQILRHHGLNFHRFTGDNRLSGTPFKPCKDMKRPNKPISQTIWADAVYVKDFMGFYKLEPEKLLKIACILNDCYQSFDMVHYTLEVHDVLTEQNTAEEYRKMMGK